MSTLSYTDDLRTAPTTFRPFRPDPVQPTVLSAALERARLAQWRLITVTDPATRQEIRDAHLPHWRAHLAETGGARILAADAPARQARDLRVADTFALRLHEAPVHLVLLGRACGSLRTTALTDLADGLRAEGMDAAPLPCAHRAAAEIGALLELEDGLVVSGVLAARPVR
ncbi:MAG TPA: hypothetical protein VFG42_07450 [Baekduia sp.]|uniref:hypothetical protein n=1 Tax=Baekduia sp. TaxID=2600305 RepID=UPI002D79A6CF|nr:hypothetical protein [Baekduia sp.]HET6506607.1 hypothetical protein [Baekduia sp.]